MARRRLSRALLLALTCGLLAALPAGALAARPSAGASQDAAACNAGRVSVVAATVARADDATLCLLNRERSSRGLTPLRMEGRLGRAALAHSQDMVRNGYFAHESRDGRTPFQRMLATRYVPKGASWSLGENLGWGTGSLGQPASVVKAWMNSPPHRANILNPRFRDIGIGIAIGVPVAGDRYAGQAGATYTTDFGQHS